jgi:hypothetical protein
MKQENIHEVLKAEGPNYRIGDIEVEVGVSPKLAYDSKNLKDE